MMVMFATATTASLKKTNDVVIMLKNHERAIHVNAGGKVTATDISLAQFFSMESVGDIFSDTFKIALFAKEVGRYLCFRRGKLVGMKNLTRDCHFIESLDHGYFLYANAYNPLWRVGFTKGLKPVGPRHWKRPQTLKRACFLFVKINAEHFDRSRFTTTTTTAPKAAANKAATAVTLKEGHKLYDSKASIIDSNRSNNNNNNKRNKSANDGKRQLLINSEKANATAVSNRQWSERDALNQRHRKRKHHAKLTATGSNGSGGLLLPKNLVRHHHDQGNGKGRRRQHQREEKERKLRLQNQRRKQQEDDDKVEPEPMLNATNSATPSVAATTLAATASLAPSALNIVAMLAAGRRKRGRRKKQAETSVTNVSSNSGHHQAMDLQLVAQSPLQAQSQYDRVQLDGIKSHDHHEHIYHQKHQYTIAPVNRTSPSTKKVIKVQQQHHKYSNINTDSQLSSSSSSSRSHSRSSNSINSNNLSHNYNLNLNVNNVNNLNNLNNNNNDNSNAIPALPKKYLSKNNFNNEYLMQQTTRSLTDFNTKEQQQQLSHSSNSRNVQQQQQHQQQHLQITKADHSHTSHHHNHNKLPLKLSDQDDDDDSAEDSDDDSYTNDENSNRLLVNNSNISDNNLQQEHLVNRLKLIYLDRIRSHNFNLKLKANNKHYLNNTQIQQMQHYNNYNGNNSPISSTTETTNENLLILENYKERNDFSPNIEFEADNSVRTRRRIQNRSSRSTFATFATATSKKNNNHSHSHSHRRTTRNSIKDNITNNNKNVNYKNYANEESKYIYVNNFNTNNNNNAKSKNINRASGSSSSNGSRSSSSHIRNNKLINVLGNINDNKVNIFENSKPEYLNILMPSTTAYRSSKLLTILGQQKILKQQLQQQIIKLINNPNKYNYNNYNDNDNEYNDDDVGGKFKRIQNKYEKSIVQYRSVFN